LGAALDISGFDPLGCLYANIGVSLKKNPANISAEGLIHWLGKSPINLNSAWLFRHFISDLLKIIN
jgi:hypothetical protein